MNRHNFYVDEDRMKLLRRLAKAEGDSVSELLREAIDLIIANRMNNPRPSLAERRQLFSAFMEKYAGRGGRRSTEEIDALIDEVSADYKRRPRKRKVR